MIPTIFAIAYTIIGIVTLVCFIVSIAYAIPPSKPILTEKEEEQRLSNAKWSGIVFGSGIGVLLLLSGIHYLVHKKTKSNDTVANDTVAKINTDAKI